MEIRDDPHDSAAPSLAKGYQSASPAPSFIANAIFSNERLNFKHSFWAAQGPEQGIFAAFHRLAPQINSSAAAAIQKRPNG